MSTSIWLSEERKLLIDILELSTIQLALLHWSVFLKGLLVRMQLDNSKHHEGRRSCAAQEEGACSCLGRNLTFWPFSLCTFPEWKFVNWFFSAISSWYQGCSQRFVCRGDARCRSLGLQTQHKTEPGFLWHLLEMPWWLLVDQFCLIYAFPPLQLLPLLLRMFKVEGILKYLLHQLVQEEHGTPTS